MWCKWRRCLCKWCVRPHGLLGSEEKVAMVGHWVLCPVASGPSQACAAAAWRHDAPFGQQFSRCRLVLGCVACRWQAQACAAAAWPSAALLLGPPEYLGRLSAPWRPPATFGGAPTSPTNATLMAPALFHERHFDGPNFVLQTPLCWPGAAAPSSTLGTSLIRVQEAGSAACWIG